MHFWVSPSSHGSPAFVSASPDTGFYAQLVASLKLGAVMKIQLDLLTLPFIDDSVLVGAMRPGLSSMRKGR